MSPESGSWPSEKVPVPPVAVSAGNGTRIVMHRDHLMGRVLLGCLAALVGMGVLSVYRPPNDWSSFTKICDILGTTISSILTAYFALSRTEK